MISGVGNMIQGLQHVTRAWPLMRKTVERFVQECSKNALQVGTYETTNNQSERARLILELLQHFTDARNVPKLFDTISQQFNSLLVNITIDIKKIKKRKEEFSISDITQETQELYHLFVWIVSLDKLKYKRAKTKVAWNTLQDRFERNCVSCLRSVVPSSWRVHLRSGNSLRRTMSTIKKMSDDIDDHDLSSLRQPLSLDEPKPFSAASLSGALGRSPEGLPVSEVQGQHKHTFTETMWKRGNPDQRSDSDRSDEEDEAVDSSTPLSSASSTRTSSLKSSRKRKRNVHFSGNDGKENQDDLIASKLSAIADGNFLGEIKTSLSNLSALTTDAHAGISQALNGQGVLGSSLAALSSDSQSGLGQLMSGQVGLGLAQQNLGQVHQEQLAQGFKTLATAKQAHDLGASLTTIRDNQTTLGLALAEHKNSMAPFRRDQLQIRNENPFSMVSQIPHSNSFEQGFLSDSSSSFPLVPQARPSSQNNLGSDLAEQMRNLSKILDQLKPKPTNNRREESNRFYPDYNNTGPCEICQQSHPFWKHPNLENAKVNCLWEKKKGKCGYPETCKMVHNPSLYP
jgi:hypothetical protein